MTALQAANRAVPGRLLAREVAFPALAVAVIVKYADIRMAMGLPGHCALIWLTLLVAVTLTTHRRATVVGVGAASTMASLMLPGLPGPWVSARYLAAALLLYAVVALPLARRRPWLIALAAAPINLVALFGAVAARHHAGHMFAVASTGMTDRVLFHLGFGLVAGLLGWVVAAGLNRPASPPWAARPGRNDRERSPLGAHSTAGS